MEVQKFNVGDKVRLIWSKWEGEVIEINRNPHKGYKIKWTQTFGNKWAKESWVTPLNLELV